MKSLIKALLRRTPYRVIRARDANRFSAIEECLEGLGKRGYRPLTVIDGGANIGAFAQSAARIFPSATIHLIEPQPNCHPALQSMARNPRFRFHGVALGSSDGNVALAVSAEGTTTGAHVVTGSMESDGVVVQVPVVPLDVLLGKDISPADRALLKLDLQGWEMEALRGAETILNSVEVALVEVSFYLVAYEPSIEALVQFFDSRGFGLHDIAALHARRRDNRAHQGDFVFVKRVSPLSSDNGWQ